MQKIKSYFSENTRPSRGERLWRLRLLRLTFLLIGFMLSWPPTASAQVDTEQLEEEAIRNAVAGIEPSVIRFETIGGIARVEGMVVSNGPATGLAVSPDGYVVSASFHFAHEPATILARLPDGKRAAAEIVGRDFSRKIVLLKIKSDFNFKIPEIAKPSGVQVGQTVIAVGRVFDPDKINVSTGIVSAKNRVWNKALQTDAKISAANFGGPLLDLKGKVIGILVPMSPEDDSEMAGTQWYDSGIGFAVPLVGIMDRLEQLKSGKPLRAGLLGISLKGSDIYADPAIVAFCNGASPAGKSGVQTDDKIVEINKTQITRQSEMKHALGPLYEGDFVSMVVLRNGKRIPLIVELAGKIEPYLPAALGVILGSTRKDDLVIQQIVPDSPAEDAGFQTGDRFKQFDDIAIKSPEQLRQKIAAADVGSESKIIVDRSGKELTIQVKTGLQTANPIPASREIENRDFKVTEIKVADMANQCFAIVPLKPSENGNPALMVWVPAPGKITKASIEKRWLELCEKHNIILLVPESTDEKRWRPDDMDFVVGAIDKLAKQTSFDRDRVVIGGIKSGGSMASLIAFNQRNLFQGIVLINAMISSRVRQLETSPVEPLLIWIGTSTNNDDAKQTSKALREANLPVHVEFDATRQTLDQWIDDVFSWAKTVNRI